MKNILKSLIAYISILIAWYIFIIMVLDIAGFIELNVKNVGSLSLIGVPFAIVYHKYKPMKFKELLTTIKQSFNS